MSDLNLARGLRLPLDAVTRATAIVGQRGTGKTSTAVVFVEEAAAAGAHFAVVDPTGAWYGLTSNAKGSGPGLDAVVMGGHNGDVPLDPDSGALVARLVVEERYSVVLDLEKMSKKKQIKFVAEFAETLYDINRQALTLVIDEAHRFCLSDDTELLTSDGWKRWPDIAQGALAVAFDPVTEQLRHEPILDVQIRHHDGDMVHLKTDRLDCLTTPDHRVLLQRTQRAVGRQCRYPWAFVSAGDVPQQVSIPGAGRPIYGPGLDGFDAEHCRMLGWIITDGWIHSRRYHYLGLQQAYATVKDGIMLAEEMATITGRYGASRSERPARTSGKGGGPSVQIFLGRTLSDRLVGLLGDDIHRIPRRLLAEGNREQLEALYLGLLEGDGTHDPRWGWIRFYPGQNETLADDFQELAMRLGINVRKRWVPSIGQWHVMITRRIQHYIREPRREHYNGTVWDITIPSGAFVARRNGTVFVTGNCPQQMRDNERGGFGGRCLGAVTDVATLGRRKGLGAVAISQRPAKIHKDVFEECEIVIAHRLMGANDRKAIRGWLEEKDEEAKEDAVAAMSKLRTLGEGHALVYAPTMDVFGDYVIRRKRTFDSSATPEIGGEVVLPKKRSDIDLTALEERMAETLERQKEDDPKELKKRVRELQAQVDSAKDSSYEAGFEHGYEKGKLGAEPEIKEVPALEEDEVSRIDKAVADLKEQAFILSGISTEVAGEVAHLQNALDMAREIQRGVDQSPSPLTPAPDPPIADTSRFRSKPDKTLREHPTTSMEKIELGVAAKDILSALAGFPEGLTREQISLLTGRRARGGSWNTAMKKVSPYVEQRGDRLVITDMGRALVPDAHPIPQREIVSRWRGSLPTPAREVLDVMLTREDGSYREFSIEFLAEATGRQPRGGSWNTALKALRESAIVEPCGSGELRLSSDLYLVD